MGKFWAMLRGFFFRPGRPVNPDAHRFPDTLRPAIGEPAPGTDQTGGERTDICSELADMEATALRHLAEAQENLEKVRALQRKAGCRSIRLN